MSTFNADVATAHRLGLTFSHRIARYGSLVARRPTQDPMPPQGSIAGLGILAGAVEGFFAWGVGEIPRQAVQDAYCQEKDGEGSIDRCRPCIGHPKSNGHPTLKFDRVVNIPMELSYKFPGNPTKRHWQMLEQFLKQHNQSNTIFQMPVEVCASSPTYTGFDQHSRAWFYHKYWDAHAVYVHGDPRATRKIPVSRRMYRDSWKRTLHLPGVPRRPKLRRLHQHELTIAVHARRGDFFKDKRPMVSAKSFASIIREVVAVVKKKGGIFATMPVKVNIYSEGMPVAGSWTVGHNIEHLSKTFLDSDGTELKVCAVKKMIRHGVSDNLGNLFDTGLKVQFHISEDTIRSLHEMVASDIFIGSLSSMSHHLVGSLARGAMQIFPNRYVKTSDWYGHVQFNSDTGKILDKDKSLVPAYWDAFEKANRDSAKRAWQQTGLSHRKLRRNGNNSFTVSLGFD